jgi:hypothetical protein
MKVSTVAVTFTHDDDSDPVGMVDDMVGYAVNRGLFDAEIGLAPSTLVITAPIGIVEDDIPDWDSIQVGCRQHPGSGESVEARGA